MGRTGFRIGGRGVAIRTGDVGRSRDCEDGGSRLLISSGVGDGFVRCKYSGGDRGAH